MARRVSFNDLTSAFHKVGFNEEFRLSEALSGESRSEDEGKQR